MPRYVVERTFADGLFIPCDSEGAIACLNVVDRNMSGDVSWVNSFVTPDKTKCFCIYDGPNVDAIEEAARRNSLPVDTVTEVRVLDPYFYY